MRFSDFNLGLKSSLSFSFSFGFPVQLQTLGATETER